MSYKCRNCNSENVEQTMWVNVNTMKLSDNPSTEDDEAWCNVCETTTSIYDDEQEELYKKALSEIQPECSEYEEIKEEMGIDCEFELQDGTWWCTTHNCHA
jgi:hypothetical protein